MSERRKSRKDAAAGRGELDEGVEQRIRVVSAPGDDQAARRHVGERDDGQAVGRLLAERRQLVAERGQADGSVPLHGPDAFVDRAHDRAVAQRLAGPGAVPVGARRLYLASTHFHPEHAFGADVFAGEATFLVNKAQAEDLSAKGAGYLEMFRGLDKTVAKRLEHARVPTPDFVYEQSRDLDLGDRVVRLRAVGRAHSKGDQVITVPDADVLFTGDLAETGQFAIFPWFPPHDTDVSGLGWIEVMTRLAADRPRTVVPGHGEIGGTQVIEDVLAYLRELRDETWRRRDSAMSQATIIEEVRAVLVARHPEWAGREWIDTAVACLFSEHAQ